jgi:hypothetical protein
MVDRGFEKERGNWKGGMVFNLRHFGKLENRLNEEERRLKASHESGEEIFDIFLGAVDLAKKERNVEERGMGKRRGEKAEARLEDK